MWKLNRGESLSGQLGVRKVEGSVLRLQEVTELTEHVSGEPQREQTCGS